MDFKSRKDAGQKLAAALNKLNKAPKTIAVGLPRGGVVVAAQVARALSLELDIIVPRKVGAPHNKELAIGAIAGDEIYLDQEMVSMVGATPEYIEQEVAKEKKEAKRRLSLFRKKKPVQNFSGFTVILIDDGIATGATMQAAIAYMKKMKAAKIIVAIPVAPPDTLAKIEKEVDEVVCLFSSANFMAVGQFYEDFPQIEDSEVIAMLDFPNT